MRTLVLAGDAMISIASHVQLGFKGLLWIDGTGSTTKSEVIQMYNVLHVYMSCN